MSRCWTCGTETGNLSYTCPACQSLEQLKGLRGELERRAEDEASALADLQWTQERGVDALRDLTDMTAKGFAGLATALRWGFGELSWRAQQQADVLRSIDHTLKTPSETQAEEWRQMAEKLRARGVLGESEEFYIKALDQNRLDYRVYVGLAETYIQWARFDEALTMLERSLPHAPRKEIDYKSYSYRLMGHIAVSREDHKTAHRLLAKAVELSPAYPDGQYDLAQYSGLLGESDKALGALAVAIDAQPSFWYYAAAERNFDPVRAEVNSLLEKLNAGLRTRIDSIAEKVSAVRAPAEAALAKAKAAAAEYDSTHSLASVFGYKSALEDLQLSQDERQSGDYLTLISAVQRAEHVPQRVQDLTNMAHAEARDLTKRRQERDRKQAEVQAADLARQQAESAAMKAAHNVKMRNARGKIPEAIGLAIGFGFAGWFLFGLYGCAAGVFSYKGGDPTSVFGAFSDEGIAGLSLGAFIGGMIGLLRISKEME